MIKKLAVLFKNDIVLLISFCLALLSCLITPPGPEYLGYLDFHTLILLFCLMLIVEGLREANFFPYIGNLLLSRTSSKRGLSLVLVFLCFVSSMFITNDVALITFVPFGILILEMAGMESRICYLIVLMTIAANLGSMFTPVGNPQNLYLYSLTGLKLHEFLLLMLPFTALSASTPCFVCPLGHGTWIHPDPDGKYFPYEKRDAPVSWPSLSFLYALGSRHPFRLDFADPHRDPASDPSEDPVYKSGLFAASYLYFLFHFCWEYRSL